MKDYKFSFELLSKYRSELMGLAIIGVMLGHLMNHTYQNAVLAQIVRLLHTPAFLFLSGFGLYYSFSKNQEIISFFKKRVARLYIPFLIIATPFFLMFLISGKISLLQFLGHITTISFWIEGNYMAMWYIAISLLLYATFPLIYHAIFNKFEKPLLFLIFILSVIFAICFSISQINPSYWEIIGNFGLSKTYIFPIGCYFGYLSKNNKNAPLSIFVVYIVICLALYAIGINKPISRTLLALPLFCILLDYIFADNKFKTIQNVLFWMGKYSLEIYLLHVLIHFTLMDIVGINDSISMPIGIVLSLILCKPISTMIAKIIK